MKRNQEQISCSREQIFCFQEQINLIAGQDKCNFWRRGSSDPNPKCETEGDVHVIIDRLARVQSHDQSSILYRIVQST